MRFPLVVVVLLAAPLAAQRPPTVVPRAGLVITRSVIVRPGTYDLPATDSTPILTIRGNSLTVELTGVVLRGSPRGTAPDRFHGTAIRVDGGTGVVLRGATLRGYKVGILARGTRGLTLERNDVGYNWKPRLYSVPEHESLVDWLSYHHNEADEWLRYGAGIYLVDVAGGEIRGNVARQGMNGLLLTRSRDLRIWNNDFSFLSGLGIGLYRSAHNVLMHNRVDWCVRGYSHGVYARGQDSAALLMFEQSSDNIVAYNSMTHGGDGLFLWAGQSTMDSGTGGSNDNLFLGNDFSFAPTNGMEATFSRNRFVDNLVEGSTHGLWGGYSFESEIIDNRFVGNRIGIAIEHGQDLEILGNSFDADSTAIRLWWNAIEPSDWGYPKHRDTRSRDIAIAGNRFSGNRVALRMESTTGLHLGGNEFSAVDTIRRQSGDSTGLAVTAADGAAERSRAALRANTLRATVPPLPGGQHAVGTLAARRGRETILVDEWGPYDWQSPRLWPLGPRDSTPIRLRVLGPTGGWRVRGLPGVAGLSKMRGRVGDTITVTPEPGREHDWSLTLEFRGARSVSPAGDTTAANGAVRFGYRRFEPIARWSVSLIPWDSTSDPRRDSVTFRQRLDAAIEVSHTPRRLDWVWYRPVVTGVPQDHWAARARADVELTDGPYCLRTISDDGLRAWVDDRLVIDDWTPHESAVDTAPLTAGAHRLTVEYYQVDGWTELQVAIVPAGEGGCAQ